jgi:hypothetical protein
VSAWGDMAGTVEQIRITAIMLAEGIGGFYKKN